MAQKEIGIAYRNNFGSFAYTGYLADDGLEWSLDYETEDKVTDADGDVVSKLFQNPQDKLSAAFFILSTVSITPPRQGDTIAFTDPAGASVSWMCQSANHTFTRQRTKLNLELIKEAGMTYT